MAVSRFAKAEKQRIVELALRGESPFSAIARDHGICRNTLCRWVANFRAETSKAPKRLRGRTSETGATFLPVTIAGAARVSRPTPNAGSSVEITLASGVSIRIVADALDARFICALIAELRR